MVAHVTPAQTRPVPESPRRIHSPRYVPQENGLRGITRASIDEDCSNKITRSLRTSSAKSRLATLSSSAVEKQMAKARRNRSCYQSAFHSLETLVGSWLASMRFFYTTGVRKPCVGMLSASCTDNWRFQQLCLHDFKLGWLWRLSGLYTNQCYQQCCRRRVLDNWHDHLLRHDGLRYELYCP